MPEPGSLLSALQGPVAFRTTRWSVVLRAGQEEDRNATGALEALCRAYWYPIQIPLSQYPAVHALAVAGDELFVGASSSERAGRRWTALGLGMAGENPPVYALAGGANLNAGGSFMTTGRQASAYVARAMLDAPAPLTLGNLGLVEGRFQFTLNGPTEASALIEVSTDLQHWNPVLTKALPGGTLTVTDPLPASVKFYRATAP